MVFMITFSGCGVKCTFPSTPLPCGVWKVVSVTSSLGAGNVQPKFGQAVGGTLELPCTSSGIYTFGTSAGAITTGGTGTAVITTSDVTTGNMVLDTKVTLVYSGLTTTSVTLVGDVTADTGVSTQNIHTIVLSRQ